MCFTDNLLCIEKLKNEETANSFLILIFALSTRDINSLEQYTNAIL